jgi:hypothetical protein
MAKPKPTHCTDCGKDLQLDPAYTIWHGVSTIRGHCKTCHNKRQCKANLINPNGVRDAQLRYRLGTTLERYNELLKEQGGVCAICKQVCTSGRDLAADHNHLTDEIRGLLCHRCNRGIGLLREDPNIINSAYEYLSRTTWDKGMDMLEVGVRPSILSFQHD